MVVQGCGGVDIEQRLKDRWRSKPVAERIQAGLPKYHEILALQSSEEIERQRRRAESWWTDVTVIFDTQYSTVVEYYAADGTAYFWQPEQQIIFTTGWDVSLAKGVVVHKRENKFKRYSSYGFRSISAQDYEPVYYFCFDRNTPLEVRRIISRRAADWPCAYNAPPDGPKIRENPIRQFVRLSGDRFRLASMKPPFIIERRRRYSLHELETLANLR